MSDNSQALAVQTADAARERALAKIKKCQADGAMIYVRQEDLDTQGLFVPVPTVISAVEDDFHKISGGKLMPKGYHTEKIAHATGTSVYDVSTRKDGHYTWVGSAKGRRRMPDGTFEEKAAEYEFDAEMRAEEDFLADTSKYPTDVDKQKHLLALSRFARQRAETGASLRVIRKLATIPTAFGRNDIEKSMVFVRIEVNTSEIAANPLMARAAVELAIGSGGAVEQIYGPQGAATQPQAALPAPTGETIDGKGETIDTKSEPGDAEVDPEFADAPFDETPEETYRRRLGTYLKDWDLPESAQELLKGLLEIKEPLLASLKDMDKRIGDYLVRKGRVAMAPEGRDPS